MLEGRSLSVRGHGPLSDSLCELVNMASVPSVPSVLRKDEDVERKPTLQVAFFFERVGAAQANVRAIRRIRC